MSRGGVPLRTHPRHGTIRPMPKDDEDICVFPDCGKPSTVHAEGSLDGTPHTERYCEGHWWKIKFAGPKWQFPDLARESRPTGHARS